VGEWGNCSFFTKGSVVDGKLVDLPLLLTFLVFGPSVGQQKKIGDVVVEMEMEMEMKPNVFTGD